MSNPEVEMRLHDEVDETSLVHGLVSDEGTIVVNALELRSALNGLHLNGSEHVLIGKDLRVGKAAVHFASDLCLLNREEKQLYVDDTVTHILPKEYQLLEALADQLGKPVLRRTVERYIWGNQYGNLLKSPFNVTLSRLHQHLDDAYLGLGHKSRGVIRRLGQGEDAMYTLLEDWPGTELSTKAG